MKSTLGCLSSILLALAVSTASLSGAQSPQNNEGLEQRVEALLAPGRDFLDVKLTVDAIVKPSVTIGEGKAAVDELTAALLPMAKDARTAIEKLLVLRRFLYQTGPWNGFRPFAYDMKDPLGKNLSNKLLAHYIRTRLGNCVTMPMLALILGRRIGLKMTLALAPHHVFIKLTDDAGRVWNIEATSGLGSTREAWIRKELPMTDKAVQEGIYLRPLSETENAALVVTFLIERDMKAANRPEDAIATANVLLRHNPRDATALIWRGSAYHVFLKRNVIDVYSDLGALPSEIRAFADALYMNNQADFAAAEALGWTEWDGIKQ